MKARTLAISIAMMLAAVPAAIGGASSAFAANTLNAMKKAVYHAHFGKGQAFYEELSDTWYHVDGNPIKPEGNRFRNNEDGFTCDLEKMVIFNPDGSENGELSIICKDLLTSELFTFTQYNGAPIYADTHENMISQRMRASMPLTRELSLDRDGFRCLCIGNSMPIMAIEAKLDGNYSMTSVDYEHYGDICFESYTNSGDVNLDGALTVSDAVLLARIAAEDASLKVSELGLTLSDLTDDGLTDVGDVTAALCAIAGLPYHTDNPPISSTTSSSGGEADTSGTVAAETTIHEYETTYCETTFCQTTFYEGTTATHHESKETSMEVTTGFPKNMEDYLTVNFYLTSGLDNRQFYIGDDIKLYGLRFSAEFIDPINGIEERIQNELVSDFLDDYIQMSGDALTATEPGWYELILTYDRGEALGSTFRVERTVSLQIELLEAPATSGAPSTTYSETECTTTFITTTFPESGTVGTTASTTFTTTVTIPPIVTLPTSVE